MVEGSVGALCGNAVCAVCTPASLRSLRSFHEAKDACILVNSEACTIKATQKDSQSFCSPLGLFLGPCFPFLRPGVLTSLPVCLHSLQSFPPLPKAMACVQPVMCWMMVPDLYGALLGRVLHRPGAGWVGFSSEIVGDQNYPPGLLSH